MEYLVLIGVVVGVSIVCIICGALRGGDDSQGALSDADYIYRDWAKKKRR
jgi:hypothetical protein